MHPLDDQTYGWRSILLAVSLMIVAVLSEVPEASAQSSDPGPGKVIAIVPIAGPQGLAVNPTTNRIYVAMPLSGLIAVINGATNTQVETIPSSSWPLEAAVNTSNKRVYVATYGGQEVDVIEGVTNTLLGGVFIGSNTFGVGVDPTRRRVYVGRTFGADGVAVIAECPLDSEGNFACPP